MDSHTGLGGEHPQRLSTGIWQLRRVGPPSTVPNSSSLIRLKDHGEVTVGRSPAADYFVDSAITLRLISRIHVSIIGQVQSNGTPKFTIINRGLNGTYINDIKMGFPSENKQVLREGDKVTFGHPGCASIQPGSCAPQPDSEFQFIFEFIPAPTSTLLKDNNSQERTAAPCNENFQHNLLNHKTIQQVKTVDAEALFPLSDAKAACQNSHIGARLTDSPQSNASTSEKENEIGCAGARDVKMPAAASATVDEHCAILPSKSISSLQSLGKPFSYERLKDDLNPVSKYIQPDNKLTTKFSTIASPVNVPSDHLQTYNSQEMPLPNQNKKISTSSHECVLLKHQGDSVPKMDFTDTFSSLFCSNGGSVQINSTTIVLRDECEDDEDEGHSSFCSSSSNNDVHSLLTPPPGSHSTAVDAECMNNKVKSHPYVSHDDLCPSRKKMSLKSLSFQSASSRHTHSTGSSSGSDKEDTLSKSSEDDNHSELNDVVTSKPGPSEHADASFHDSPATKSILCPKDHRISHDLLKLANASSLKSKEKAILEISGAESDSSSSSYKVSSFSRSVSSSDSISPPDLSPQVPAAQGMYHRKSPTLSISSDSSKTHSSSESDTGLSEIVSRSRSTVSSTAAHRNNHRRSSPSGSSSRSSKSNLVKPQKKTFLRDLVPLMYSSSDEDEVFMENRTKEIVKKIYSPHKKKRSKMESKPKSISRHGELLSLDAELDSGDRGISLSPALMPTSPSLSPSSSSNSSASSWSRSPKKTDLATTEVIGVCIQVSDTSSQKDCSSNSSQVHPKLDLSHLPSSTKIVPEKNSLTHAPSSPNLPKKNTGLSIRTEHLPSQTKQCNNSYASSSSSPSSSSTSVPNKNTGLSIRKEKDDFCAKLKKSSISSASSSSSTSSSSPSLLQMSNESGLLRSTQPSQPRPPPHRSTSSEQSQPSASIADISKVSLGPVSVKSHQASETNLGVQILPGMFPSYNAKLTKAAGNAEKEQTYKTDRPSSVKDQKMNISKKKSKLPDPQSIPSQASNELNVSLGQPSDQQNPTLANDLSNKSSAKNVFLKKLSEKSEPFPTVKAQTSKKKVTSSVTKISPKNTAPQKPKESSAQGKPSAGVKFGQGKSTLPPAFSETISKTSSQTKKTSGKPPICTLDDSAFMKDLENSVTIKEKLTRGKATVKTSAKKAAVENKESLLKDSTKGEKNNVTQSSTNEFLHRKRKFSSDEDDSSDVPRLTRTLTTTPGAKSKQSSTLSRTKRALTRNSSLSSSSSTAKTKRKKKPAKKSSQSKSKRRKKIVSDTTSEEDIADESAEDEEDEEEDDWDLPDGVQYYDNLCSAAKCLNPVGNKVDWVMCDYCEQWYHVVCIDCPIEVIQKENVQFHCGLCPKKN